MRGSAFRSATRFFKSEKQRQGRSGLTEAFTCAPEIRFSFSFRARRRGDRERRDTTALGRCPRETEEPLYGSFVHLFDDPSFVSVPLCQFPSPHQRSCNPSLRGGAGLGQKRFTNLPPFPQLAMNRGCNARSKGVSATSRTRRQSFTGVSQFQREFPPLASLPTSLAFLQIIPSLPSRVLS